MTAASALVTTPPRWAFAAIGVPWTIETPTPLDDDARDAVEREIARFDAVWSRFRDDSTVARIAREPGVWRLPAEAAPLLDLYRRLYEATDGRVSPLVGRALEELGYDASYRLTPAATRTPVPAWDDALAWDGRELHTVRPVLLDVGAAGKGLLVDLVGAVLAEHGHADAVVDASGDLRVFGRGARAGARSGGAGGGRADRATAGGGGERVALEHPGDPELAIGVVDLPSGALCGSAVNRRAWAGAHHVLDALTGLPTADVVATWALVTEPHPYAAMLADGAATALFFAPGDRVRASLGVPAAPGVREDGGVPGFHWVRVLANGRVERSPDFPGELFA